MMKPNGTIYAIGSLLLLISLLGSQSVLAIDVANVKTGGLLVSDPADKENKYWMQINGHIKADTTAFSGDTRDTRKGAARVAPFTNFPCGSHLRAVELNFNGGIGKDLTYMITLNAENLEDIEINDFYLKYTGFGKNIHVLIGQVPMPFGFENTTSSKWTSFLERSLPSQDFASTFRLGAMVHAWGKMFAASIAVTQPKFHSRNSIATQTLANNQSAPILGKSDRIGTASRFIFSPVHTKDKVYHFSLGFRYQDEFDSFLGVPINNVRFRVRPEARARNTPQILDTGPLRCQYYVVYSSEFALLKGPFTLQAEYDVGNARRQPFLRRNPVTKVDEQITGQLKSVGWYVQVSYILTGESRAYNFPTGSFGRIIPKSPCGAWEVAIRRSYLNLNSHEINGGVGYNTGIALGWYADSNIRIFGNYIRSDLHPRGERKRVLNIFGMRCQVVF